MYNKSTALGYTMYTVDVKKWKWARRMFKIRQNIIHILTLWTLLLVAGHLYQAAITI